MKYFKLTLYACIILCLSSCTTEHIFEAQTIPYSTADLLLLPLKPIDSGYGKCGVDASVAVINFYIQQKRLNSNKIKIQLINLKRRRFASIVELFVFFKSCGLIPNLGRFTKKELLKDLNNGKPIIVFIPPYNIENKFNVDIGYSHCWVVTGVSRSNDLFIILTPGTGPVAIKIADFLRYWNKEGNIAIRFNLCIVDN